MFKPQGSAVDRFFAKVDETTGCWIWQFIVDKNGYGRFWLDGTTRRAHRVIYAWTTGNLDDELQIDHLCRNTGCVNPEHLELVTAQVNVLRSVGVAAINSQKIYCPQNHEYNFKNTRYKNTKRFCRICYNKQKREYRQRRKLREAI